MYSGKEVVLNINTFYVVMLPDILAHSLITHIIVLY